MEHLQVCFSEPGTASLRELMESNLVEAPQEEIVSGTQQTEWRACVGGTGVSAVSYLGKEGSLQGFV